MGRELHLVDCFVRQATTGEMVRWLYNLYERSLEEGASIQFYMESNLMQDTALDEFQAEGDIESLGIRLYWIQLCRKMVPSLIGLCIISFSQSR